MTPPVVVFDLDDTLYPERDFVRSGFRAVALRCETRTGIAGSAVFDLLWQGFLDGIRGDAFDRLLARQPDLGRIVTVPELVEVYRGHVPSLKMWPGIPELLRQLETRGHQLALITDGESALQRRKLVALGHATAQWFVVVTGELGPDRWKPDPAAYVAVESWSGRPGSDHLYVADNPLKDFLTPRARGWSSLRLRLPEQLRVGLEPDDQAAAPDAEVRSVVALTRRLLGVMGDG